MSQESISSIIFFFFNDTATTEIYTLSLHDALPISVAETRGLDRKIADVGAHIQHDVLRPRSEEHTSELQSRLHLVCRLLLEKKKNMTSPSTISRITRNHRASPVH